MPTRRIDTEFWDDPKVEDLSSTGRYLLLYLLTSPCGNIIGCYEITTRHIARDMKLKDAAVRTALNELRDSNIVEYSDATNEVLVRNWWKYNLTRSKNLVKPYVKAMEEVKSDRFKSFLAERFEELFKIPYRYGMDTVSLPYGRDSISISISTPTGKGVGVQGEGEPAKRDAKHKHGTFSNVLLTDAELASLKEKFPDDWQERIDDLSHYVGSTGKSYKSHYRTILSWDRRDRKPAAPKKGVSADAKYAKYH